MKPIKKALSMVLAVAMMSTMAFATTYEWGDPTVGTSDVNGVYTTMTVKPGDTVKVPASYFYNSKGDNLNIKEYDLDDATFTIATKKFSKGADLVEKIYLDDDCVKIKLKQNYTQEVKDGKVNVTISELTLKSKKTVKDSSDTTILRKNDSYSFRAGTGVSSLKLSVGYPKEVRGVDTQLAVDLSGSNGMFVEWDKENNTTSGAAEVTFGDIASAEGRVYDGDEIYYGYDEDADTDILKAYPDAELTFANIHTNGFPSTMNFELYAEEDAHVYEVKNGKLVKSSLKWDKDAYAFTGKIRSATSYVISDVKLDVSASDNTEDNTSGNDNTANNPDTGANDVVGVATALAVVSLISAGAVAMKK